MLPVCCAACHTRNLSVYGLFPKPWLTHTCFGLILHHGLHKSMLCKKAMVYAKRCFKQNLCYALKTMLYTKTRPVQVLFVPCRIARSMVAGGTCRCRFNKTHTNDDEPMKPCLVATSSWGFFSIVPYVFPSFPIVPGNLPLRSRNEEILAEVQKLQVF